MSLPRDTEFPIDPLFTRRWSPRAFTGEPIPRETLSTFLEAARWAPSAFNSQPWRFIVGHRDTAGWGPIFDSLAEFNKTWAQRASALMVIVSRTQWVPPGKSAPEPLRSHSFDTGAAWASIAFQATLSGWHVHGIGGFDRDRLRALLGIPADHAVEAVVAVGRQGDPAVLSDTLRAREQPNQRQSLASLVSEGRFDFPA
jgi:nitroreductase